MRFKLSQLQDAKFYQEHRDDIGKAYKLGLIEDDMGGGQVIPPSVTK
jgi:hypothetical protein